MQKNILSSLLILCAGCFFTACSPTTPQQYFERSVLNTNMMTGFANDGLQREMDQPTAKLVEGTKDQTEPMKRKEIIDSKIEYTEETIGKLKDLKQTAETKEMIQTSIAINEYVLAVYKNEYSQLAKLYDEGAAKETIASHHLSIHDKYFQKFEDLFIKLTGIGKLYAEKNEIKVTWLN